MKKLLSIAVIALIGFGATSCNNDDDSSVNPLVGVWKAETVSYTIGNQTHTYPYNIDGGPFAGCDVDFLTLNTDHVASLEEHLKNDEDVCEPVFTEGTWNELKVNVKGVEREIDSIEGNELVLSYPLTLYGQTLPITVVYSRQ